MRCAIARCKCGRSSGHATAFIHCHNPAGSTHEDSWGCDHGDYLCITLLTAQGRPPHCWAIWSGSRCCCCRRPLVGMVAALGMKGPCRAPGHPDPWAARSALLAGGWQTGVGILVGSGLLGLFRICSYCCLHFKN